MNVETSAKFHLQPRIAASDPAAECGAAPAIKEIIREETVRACTEKNAGRMRGIVLTGSVARDEGTVVKNGDGWELLGDAEFILVFDDRASLPDAVELIALSRQIEESVSRRNLECRVQMSVAHPAYLQRLRPHIFAYELRERGQVVWGDPNLLSGIPRFSAAEIPLEDAWRLLCNRMIEMLEAAAESGSWGETLPPALLYRTSKLYLDMATSLLVFVGAYQPTYRARAEELRRLAANPSGAGELPFELGKFSRHVTACTEWKLHGKDLPWLQSEAGRNGTERGFWEAAVSYARLLWRWELQRMTRTQRQLPNDELVRRWMRRQAPQQRLRGWLYVARKQGWCRSWRSWSRWMRRAWRASPRYWVYAAAGELFFRLPCVVKPTSGRSEADVRWEELRSWLPVNGDHGPMSQPPSWRRLAQEISWNYGQFLVGTRS